MYGVFHVCKYEYVVSMKTQQFEILSSHSGADEDRGLLGVTSSRLVDL
jgi:hypothetical protein